MGESRQQRSHPEHDRLVEEVRSWYRTTIPDLGYRVERRRFGSYRRLDGHPDFRIVVVESMTPVDVPELIADASTYFDNQPVEIWIEGRSLDASIGPALIAAGCTKGLANVSLAHVSPHPEAVALPGVTVEPITPPTLMDYARVKLKGFANREDEPARENLEYELAIRRREIASIGRLLVARVGGEPAAILGYYDGPDRSIFNLATRMPFRYRGIARNLLCRVLADSYDRNCRSVIIGTNPADTPIEFYQRIGFIDEVYWRRTYLFDPSTNRSN